MPLDCYVYKHHIFCGQKDAFDLDLQGDRVYDVKSNG